MKKIISSLIFLGTSSCLYADYSSHSSIAMNMGQSECIKTIKLSAQNLGFNNVRVVNSYVLYDMNNKGYSFQFSCMTNKSLGYLIINGKTSSGRSSLFNKFMKEIKKQK